MILSFREKPGGADFVEWPRLRPAHLLRIITVSTHTPSRKLLAKWG
jgi:hypothetical protein